MISEKWLQIPVAPKYEINQRGDVRNMKTGRLLKSWIPKGRIANKQVVLSIEKEGKPKHLHVHVSSLLWLTHGIIPKRETHSRIVVPVIISRGNERHFFDSCRQAAKFIAERVHYVADHIVHLLSKRREEIYGWKINYQR